MSEIDQKDLGPIIEIATQRMAAAQDELSREELLAIAEELGISAEYVDEAQSILSRQRSEERARAQAEAAENQDRLKKLGYLGGAFLVLCVLSALVSYNGLTAQLADVAQKKSQLVNVQERQEHIKRLMDDQENSPAKLAELAGSQNRIRIERKRYDESAARYNQRASGFPASLWRSIFGLPDDVPLSNDDRFRAD